MNEMCVVLNQPVSDIQPGFRGFLCDCPSMGGIFVEEVYFGVFLAPLELSSGGAITHLAPPPLNATKKTPHGFLRITYVINLILANPPPFPIVQRRPRVVVNAYKYRTYTYQI